MAMTAGLGSSLRLVQPEEPSAFGGPDSDVIVENAEERGPQSNIDDADNTGAADIFIATTGYVH